MTARIDLGDIAVDVVFKDIKNVHLSVYPPDGKVRIAAPARMSLERIRVFAVSKLRWIRQQQEKLRAQERETPRDYVDRESHSVWGKRIPLHTTLSGWRNMLLSVSIRRRHELGRGGVSGDRPGRQAP